LARSLNCRWQISVDAGVALHQHQQLAEQSDNTAAAEAEAFVGIHLLDQCLSDQTVQVKNNP